MFEVICIREVITNQAGCPPIIRVGNRYTVVEVVTTPIGEHDYYVIAEDQPDNIYRDDLFARTNGPCEVAIAETRLAEDQAVEDEAAALDAEFRQIVHEVENA